MTIEKKNVWEKKTNEINQRLNSFNVKHSQFKTLFLSGASRVSLDASDRILISKRLIEHAGLNKEVVLLGTGNSVELWSKTEYDKLLKITDDDYTSLAQDVLGNLDEGF